MKIKKLGVRFGFDELKKLSVCYGKQIFVEQIILVYRRVGNSRGLEGFGFRLLLKRLVILKVLEIIVLQRFLSFVFEI